MIRSVIQLFVGASVAQAITLASTVWLARVCYDPDAFGEFAIYIAWANIVSTLGTFRYEALIMLPDTDDEASCIGVMAFGKLVFSSVVFLVVVLIWMLFSGYSCSVLLIPFGAFGIGLNSVFTILLSRSRDFLSIGKARIVMAISTVFVQWLLADRLPISGLAVGNLVGLFVCTVLLFVSVRMVGDVSSEIMSKIKATYGKMLSTMFRSTSLNTLYQYLQPILVFRLYGEALSGHFFMAQRLLQAPVGLVTSSISQVFYRRAGEIRHHSPEKLFGLMVRVVGTMIGLLAVPMLILNIWGDVLVVWLLGEKWLEAAQFVGLLTGLVFFQGVYSPVSAIAEVVDRVEIELRTNIYFFFEMFFSLFLGWWLHDFRLGLTTFVVLTSLGYLSILVYFLRFTWLLKVRKLPLP